MVFDDYSLLHQNAWQCVRLRAQGFGILVEEAFESRQILNGAVLAYGYYKGQKVASQVHNLIASPHAPVLLRLLFGRILFIMSFSDAYFSHSASEMQSPIPYLREHPRARVSSTLEFSSVFRSPYLSDLKLLPKSLCMRASPVPLTRGYGRARATRVGKQEV